MLGLGLCCLELCWRLRIKMMTHFEVMANLNERRTKYGYSGIGGLNYNDLMAQANLESCNSRDSECVANNVAKQAAVEDYWINNGMKSSSGVPDGTVLTFNKLSPAEVQEFYSGNVLSGGNVVDSRDILKVNNTLYTPTSFLQTKIVNSGTGSYNPIINFQASRGGKLFQVGDNWKVVISSAKPGAKVTIDGSPLGVVDGSGNFSLSGTFDNSVIGNWNEKWSLDGMVVGTWDFVVVAKANNDSGGGSTILNTILGDSGSNWFTETMLGGVPNWALVAGGLVGVVMMFGGRR